MIGRLSIIITKIKESAYGSLPVRCLCYLTVALALLLFWLGSDQTEISFVYHAF